MHPSLLEFPESFDTDRLTIRAPRVGDGAELNAAIRDSFADLKPWMPWAHVMPTPPSVGDSEANIRQAVAEFIVRTDLRLLLFLKGTGTMVGSSGLHRINWDVPCFEIGYWMRTPYCGRGLMTEAVTGITAFARDQLKARRVEIRMADANVRSWKIAERAGFALEATLPQDRRLPDGRLDHTRIYAKIF
jgi:RimJ/RimL family protein N-acetyltransferase